MSSKDTRGLGRGLSALIGGSTAGGTPGSTGPGKPDEAAAGTEYQELPTSQISANPQQPRTLFSEDSIRELAESISSVGLVQPVVVRKIGDSYELVAGERRLRAARLANLEKVPAIIREASEAESLEMALIENINREDLNAMDAARAYANLQEEFGRTQEEIASRLGRSRAAVTNTMRLLELPDEVQALIEKGRLSEGHGRAILSVPDRLRQRKLATRVAAKGLSVRQTEELARREAETAGKRPRSVSSPIGQEMMDEATDALYSAFRLPVKVRWAGKAGKIEIEFTGEEQLRQVIDTLED